MIYITNCSFESLVVFGIADPELSVRGVGHSILVHGPVSLLSGKPGEIIIRVESSIAIRPRAHHDKLRFAVTAIDQVVRVCIAGLEAHAHSV